jgi:hypothetical protein
LVAGLTCLLQDTIKHVACKIFKFQQLPILHVYKINVGINLEEMCVLYMGRDRKPKGKKIDLSDRTSKFTFHFISLSFESRHVAGLR